MSPAVVITGAAGALGPVVVAEFVACGWEVVALDRPGDRLDALGADPSVHPIAADLAHQDTVATAFEQVDAVAAPSALVSLAGGFKPGSLAEVNEATVRSLWETNFGSALWCAQAVAPRLAAAGGGAIVNVGSRTAREGKAPVAHGTAKAAVLRLTEILALELRPQKILPLQRRRPADQRRKHPRSTATASHLSELPRANRLPARRPQKRSSTSFAASDGRQLGTWRRDLAEFARRASASWDLWGVDPFWWDEFGLAVMDSDNPSWVVQ